MGRLAFYLVCSIIAVLSTMALNYWNSAPLTTDISGIVFGLILGAVFPKFYDFYQKLNHD